MIHSDDNTEDFRQYCSFYLAERLYGINIAHVKEISTELAIETIYHAPSEVRGYINIRGVFYLVLDLRLFCGFAKQSIHEENRLLLFKQSVGESFGVLVDSVGDILEVSQNVVNERRQPEESSEVSYDRRGGDVSSGVCRLDKELLIVLDPSKLLHVMKEHRNIHIT